MTTTWKIIPGFPFYEASYYSGEIRSIDRDTYNPIHGTIKRKGVVLKSSINHKGYKICGVHKEGKHLTSIVHILIAKAWIPNPENKPQVNHKNGNKLDNSVDNLEWVTNLENMSHALKTGLFDKEYNRRKIENSRPVVLYTKNSEHESRYDSISLAACAINTSTGAIGNVLAGTRKTIKGFSVRYASN